MQHLPQFLHHLCLCAVSKDIIETGIPAMFYAK